MALEQISLLTSSTDSIETEHDMKSPSSGRDDASGQDRSESILKSAFEVFTDTGYSGARMDEIASRAGVAKGLIYFYYKNKEKLFEAVLKEYITKPIYNIILTTNPAESMARRLIRILDMFYARTLTGPFFSRLIRLVLIDGSRFPEAHRYYFNEVLAPVLTLLTESLHEGARRGEWKQEDIPAHPQIMFAPALILTLWRMTLAQYLNLDAKRYVREHQEYMLKALRLDDAAIAAAMAVAGEELGGDPVVENFKERDIAAVTPSGNTRKRAVRRSAIALHRKKRDQARGVKPDSGSGE